MNFYQTPKLFPAAMRITYSKGIATVTFDSILPLDDLPDNILVEIFCRLPWKFVIRCKCVCKSWSTLISLPYFQTRRALYVRNSSDDNLQILMSVPIRRHGRQAKELYTIANQTDGPELTSFNFHPSSFIPPLDIEMGVEATYNDLILMSDTRRTWIFYICNPYTKQRVALPPASFVEYAPVGFICDSDNWCCVVRLLKYRCDAFGLKLEVFTSETGKWIKLVLESLECPQGRCDGFFDHMTLNISFIAYNGTLYLVCQDGFLIGLDPFTLNNNYHCQITSNPHVGYDGQESQDYTACLGLCRGSVRMCRLYIDYIQHCVTLCVWELKEEEDDGGKTMEWCLKQSVGLVQTGFERGNPQLLALDPIDEDIIYLLHSSEGTRRNSRNIVMFNIRTMKVTDIPHKFPFSGFEIEAFPFVLPWWQCPTPVPRLDSQGQPN